MEQKDMIKKFMAGLFLFLGVVLISAVVFLIGSQKGLIQPKFPVTVLFKEVGGLNPGAPVALSGVTVGTVGDIDFLDKEVDGRSVKVTLNIFKKYEKQLRKSDRFTIITEGILGEKYVEITTRTGRERADLSRPIIGEEPLNVSDLAKSFGEAALALSETSENISNMINELQDITNTTKRLLNRVEQRIIEGNLFRVF